MKSAVVVSVIVVVVVATLVGMLGGGEGAVQAVIYGSMLAGFYFVPWMVASHREHSNKSSIAVVNLFLGWTLLGWVVALAWAYSSNGRKEQQT